MRVFFVREGGTAEVHLTQMSQRTADDTDDNGKELRLIAEAASVVPQTFLGSSV
jgi:hypothetical protein